MLSAAASGSVSDATKTNPSFAIASLIIAMTDGGGNPIPGSPFTVTTSGTTFPVPPASFAMVDSVSIQEITITVTQSASSKRATDHGGFLDWYNFINGASETPVIEHTGHSLHPNGPGDLSQQLGPFATPGAAGPWAFSLPSMGAGNALNFGSALVLTTGSESALEMDNPELQAAILPSVAADFTIPQNCLTVFNANTGVYVHGPSDNFVFKIDLNP